MLMTLFLAVDGFEHQQTLTPTGWTSQQTGALKWDRVVTLLYVCVKISGRLITLSPHLPFAVS